MRWPFYIFLFLVISSPFAVGAISPPREMCAFHLRGVPLYEWRDNAKVRDPFSPANGCGFVIRNNSDLFDREWVALLVRKLMKSGIGRDTFLVRWNDGPHTEVQRYGQLARLMRPELDIETIDEAAETLFRQAVAEFPPAERERLALREIMVLWDDGKERPFQVPFGHTHREPLVMTHTLAGQPTWFQPGGTGSRLDVGQPIYVPPPGSSLFFGGSDRRFFYQARNQTTFHPGLDALIHESAPSYGQPRLTIAIDCVYREPEPVR